MAVACRCWNFASREFLSSCRKGGTSVVAVDVQVPCMLTGASDRRHWLSLRSVKVDQKPRSTALCVAHRRNSQVAFGLVSSTQPSACCIFCIETLCSARLNPQNRLRPLAQRSSQVWSPCYCCSTQQAALCIDSVKQEDRGQTGLPGTSFKCCVISPAAATTASLIKQSSVYLTTNSAYFH